jgi:hypothetical protein
MAARWARYRKAEVDLVRDIVSEIAPETLTLLDSGLFAYDLLWSIRARGGNFLARLGAQAKPKILRELGPGDAIVEVRARSYHRKRQPDMPNKWTLRMITYRPGRSELRAAVRTFRPEGAEEDIRLITDLMPGASASGVGPARCAGPESGFTHDELADLYHDRWEEETIFGEIKTHLCDCPEGRAPLVVRTARRHGQPSGCLSQQDAGPRRAGIMGHTHSVQRDPKDHARGRATERSGCAAGKFRRGNRTTAGGDVRDDAAAGRAITGAV